MSLSALFTGALAGGASYGFVRYQMHERENVVCYTVGQIQQKLRGIPEQPKRVVGGKYQAINSREHEYYTWVREGWNAKVFGFRDAVTDFFRAK
ncbi:TPA: hypothetical protein N0F65_001917 [Lagenidium giganteum]|uniref:MICOS complex subunit MIC12 n=1 Tax=Lagenidium giganteum TaxID=4803 RepID=A0AAV2YXH9_9STRA|nr:TPA: hypothetical protein N0F65_001917 [Lagenidium giganteum]